LFKNDCWTGLSGSRPATFINGDAADMPVIRATAPANDAEIRQEPYQFGVQSPEFAGVAIVERLSFVQFRMAHA
jgi:hypothetical protein